MSDPLHTVESATLNTNSCARKNWGISALLASMPLCFALSTWLKVIPIATLFLTGLWALLRYPESRCCFVRAWPVITVCSLYFFYATVNILVHGLGWDAFDLPSHVLLLLGIATLFSLPQDERIIWLGFSISACMLGAVCLFQYYVQGIDRVYGLNGGPWGAIEFAMLLLMLALLGMLHLLDQHRCWPEQCLHALGAGLGVYGALLTQSRGPVLCFIPVYLLCVIMKTRQNGQWQRSLLLTAAVTVIVLAAILSTHAQLLRRMDKVSVEVTTYNHASNAQGSVRERIEMWRTAWRAFTQHPVEGVGFDQFGSYVRQQVAAGLSRPAIYKYNHPHNEYLEAAATGGIPGLLVIVLLLFVPLGYFLCYSSYPCRAVANKALAGVAVTFMYVLCAMTDNVLYRAMPHSFYFFFVLGLALWMVQVKKRFHTRLVT